MEPLGAHREVKGYYLGRLGGTVLWGHLDLHVWWELVVMRGEGCCGWGLVPGDCMSLSPSEGGDWRGSQEGPCLSHSLLNMGVSYHLLHLLSCFTDDS